MRPAIWLAMWPTILANNFGQIHGRPWLALAWSASDATEILNMEGVKELEVIAMFSDIVENNTNNRKEEFVLRPLGEAIGSQYLAKTVKLPDTASPGL